MGLVFVYGTLRQGEQYHHLLGGSGLFSAQAQVKGRLEDTGLGYPVLIEGEGRVAGELYEITEAVLKRLDELEDYYGPDDERNEYERIRAEASTDNGKVESWLYVYRHARRHNAIPEGDWKLYRLKQAENLLYFAYGSCMDLQRIEQAGREGCFSGEEGRGVLEGFGVAFTLPLADGGRADLVERAGRAEGKLYRITRECLENYLYAREGVEEGLYRPAVVRVQRGNGASEDAVVFVVADKKAETAPPAHYMQEILRGARPVVSAGYYAALEKRFRMEFGYCDI
ncbi:gamma-glutamylcyclotransferase [Paenibacillus sp. S150]|uniref:gamma-glutamylcyclotransferase n=1 Tax=Paenibacillus sp. S150 TaxID=2749826 RepID=UPI001C59875C|nr:gamma-glutamylcyclotransferase [Paenibacillus sp. S150]MBW4082054.1 gamma-glutamylcyclotransferase [Paenibacillus sp. S150]